MTEPDENETDYTLVVSEPPKKAPTTVADSPLIRNLIAAANEHPGEWVRIAKYTTAGSASTSASDLRNNRRTKSRPAGRWEFRSGKITDEDAWGVWAKFLGPEEPEPDEEPTS